MIRPIRLGSALAAACLVLVAAACDGETPGEPGSTPTPGQPTTTAAPGDGAQAPSVPEPLDATAFVQDPCISLTDAQIQEFTVEPGREIDEPDIPGEQCAWHTADVGVSIGVTYQPELGGLSHLYAQHATGQWDSWEETEVDGYPAVFANESRIEEHGRCSLAVGLTDSMYFRASVKGEDEADYCAAALNVASAVLSNIKAGG